MENEVEQLVHYLKDQLRHIVSQYNKVVSQLMKEEEITLAQAFTLDLVTCIVKTFEAYLREKLLESGVQVCE